MLAPVIVQSFDSTMLSIKAETSLRRTTDTFKTVNDPLRSALGSEKYLKTEMEVHYMTTDNYNQDKQITYPFQTQCASSYSSYLPKRHIERTS